MTMLSKPVAVLTVFAFSHAFARDVAFAPPTAQEVATLFDFSGPVALALRVIPKEELARKPQKGVPLVAYSYSNPANTSVHISAAVYPVGEYLKRSRASLEEWVLKHKAAQPIGDGRSVWRLVLGMGPGGYSDGALLRCRDARYEIVVTTFTDSHDDQNPKLFAHHTKPRKAPEDVVAAMETLIFR